MMIECPRCGFAQPKDQYCASCGTDIEKFLAKPKPVWVQLLQNPNLHLSLIGILIVVVVGYIFYSQGARVTREMSQLLDHPLLSRDAGNDEPIPLEETLKSANGRQALAERRNTANTAEERQLESSLAAAMAEGESEIEGGNTEAGKAAAPVTKLEMGHWEIPRDTLAQYLSSADKIGESSGGRAYYFANGAKVFESLTAQGQGQRLSLGRTLQLQPNQQLDVTTPTTTADSFQYSFYLQIGEWQNNEANVRWDATLITPQSVEAANLVETNLGGAAALTSTGLLLIVIEPTHRNLRQDLVNRAGAGPWSIFNSPEFRSNYTEWVILVQLK